MCPIIRHQLTNARIAGRWPGRQEGPCPPHEQSWSPSCGNSVMVDAARGAGHVPQLGDCAAWVPIWHLAYRE